MKKVIITGDDFGLSRAVNEGVEEAHRNGVLSTASLMVGARGSEDAVDRSHRLPSLRVGLHIALVDAAPVSPPHTIPALVDARGEFSSHLFRAGVNFFFRPGVRRQLEKEIRAQFQAFRKTGLALDHVNCHNHMHLHPTIARLMIKVGREYGLRAVRFPYEPVLPSWRASRRSLGQKLSSSLLLWPWLALLRNRLRRARVCSNHFVFGMHDSGNMSLDLVLRFLRYLPSGVTEIYFHPATGRGVESGGAVGNYHYQEELAALTSPILRQALLAPGIQRIGFSDLLDL